MSILAEFEANSGAWVAAEQRLEVRRASSTRLAQGVLPQAPEQVLEEAVRQAPGNFSTLEVAREQMASVMSAPDGMNAIANLVVSTLLDDVAAGVRDARELEASLQAVVDGFAQVPEVSDPERLRSLARELSDVASRVEEQDRALGLVDVGRQTAKTVDAILGLVDDGALSRGQVELWVEDNPVVRQSLASAKLQRVEQLGERYWRISVVSEAGEQVAEQGRPVQIARQLEQGFVMQDEQGRAIDGLSGVRSALLTPDGVLRVQGGVGLAQNELRVFTLRPIQASAVPRGRVVSPQASLSSGSNSELDRLTDALEQEARFDVWACVILDLSERIDRLWAKIIQRIERMVFKVENKLTNIVTGRFVLGLPSVGVNWKGAISELEQALGFDPGALAGNLDRLVQISDQFGIIRLSEPQGLLCDVEQSRHCQIHTALLKLRVEIDRLKQLSRLRLTGESILELAQRLGWNPSVLADALKAILAPLKGLVAQGEVWREKLRGQVCAWVRRRQTSVPAAVVGLTGVIQQMIAAFLIIETQLDLSALGVPQDARLVSVLGKLGRMGFDATQGALDQLDLVDAVLLGDQAASSAGQTSQTLATAASLTGSASRSTRLQRMSEASADRHRQLIAHQQFRSKMQARYHAPGPALGAKAIQAQGRALIIEVDSEANQLR